MRRMPIVLLLALAVALVLGATACGSTDSAEPDATTPAAQSDPTATAPGGSSTGEANATADADKALVESSCSLCHTTDRVWAAEYDRAGWETTIDRMKNNGLVISDQDYETIVAYLSGE